jgi:hypothetical protein
MNKGSPQCTLLLLVLFFFYNANLVTVCITTILLATETGFVNDVITLGFCKSTAENCRTLQAVHKRCLEWASRHGAYLAPEKYILVHFTSAETKYNSNCPIALSTSTMHHSPAVYILGESFNK